MAENNATILIPDISGFTEFVTTTELTHSSLAINMLIDAIIKAVDEDYDVAEIEGDAVLLIRKGPAPSKNELEHICLKIFNAFHFQRMWLQQHAICPCGACVSIANLTLKFVAHHGPVAEMKVGRFVKQSGPEMIIAHRLLKNSIKSNEYLLITEKLLERSAGSFLSDEMEWSWASEEYSSIGKIGYQYALLNKARREAPTPPAPPTTYRTDDTPYLEFRLGTNFRDAYMVVMNIPRRTEWIPGLQKVEQDIPQVFIGSIHRCTFESYKAIVSPLRLALSDEAIIYAESFSIEEMNLSLTSEYIFKKINDKTSTCSCRFMNADEASIPGEAQTILFRDMQQLAECLAVQCSKMEDSAFEPAFQKS